jgi:hypothetical protein
MARQPELRFGSAEEMATALDVEPAGLSMSGDPTVDMASTATQPMTAQAVMGAPLLTAGVHARPSFVGRRVITLVLVGAIAIMVVALAVVSLGGSPTMPKPVRADQPTATTTLVPVRRAPAVITPRETAPPVTEAPVTETPMTEPPATIASPAAPSPRGGGQVMIEPPTYGAGDTQGQNGKGGGD